MRLRYSRSESFEAAILKRVDPNATRYVTQNRGPGLDLSRHWSDSADMDEGGVPSGAGLGEVQERQWWV